MYSPVLSPCWDQSINGKLTHTTPRNFVLGIPLSAQTTYANSACMRLNLDGKLTRLHALFQTGRTSFQYSSETSSTAYQFSRCAHRIENILVQIWSSAEAIPGSLVFCIVESRRSSPHPPFSMYYFSIFRMERKSFPTTEPRPPSVHNPRQEVNSNNIFIRICECIEYVLGTLDRTQNKYVNNAWIAFKCLDLAHK